jgi:potassium-transporting ATPase potassium-binding subunit
MTVPGIVQILFFFVVILLLTKPLGSYMARVFSGERTFLTPLVSPLERLIYRLSGVDPAEEQGWLPYTVAMLLFSALGLLLSYAVMRLQQFLPLNPQGLDAVSPDLSFNTAASFTTNTNWQNYAGEATMSYLSQMVALAVHNFTSAAVGMAIAIALTRGLARRSARSLGNFWVDLVRGILYVLLPLSLVVALVLVWQGVPQNLNAYTEVSTLDGGSQTLAQGPIASQESIKELGTNGGGFLNANSAHPFENPNPLTNMVEMLSLYAIAAGLLYTFGRMVGDTRQGWALFGAAAILFWIGMAVALPIEQGGNPLIAQLGVDQAAGPLQSGGNFEGKEVRYGISASVLWAVITTNTSCGAVNAMHDSFMPLAGLVPLLNIQLGEVIFGGVGAGLFGILVYAIMSVFIAGLMVGRTPEYLGKKIESAEMKLVMLIVLVLAADILGFTAVASVNDAGTAGILNPGPHGLSEMLYAYTSNTGNNGSAFAGLTGNTVYYNSTGGVAMLIGRFLMIVPIMALAGSLAAKRAVPASLGTFPTNGPLFTGLLVSVVLVVGALTFFPALSLGPIVEHLVLSGGQTF